MASRGHGAVPPPPREYRAEVLFEPADPESRFLPEGPHPCGEGHLSWVAIQHGPDAVQGSLNILDLATRRNRSYELEGRPGFAFPTTDPQAFLIGCEKKVGFYYPDAGAWRGPAVSVETSVGGTIINDAMIHGDAVIFGTKDLEFATPRAGLSAWPIHWTAPVYF